MVFSPQLGVGSSAGNLAASPTLPTTLFGWSHLGTMSMALSVSCFWLTGFFSTLFFCKLQSQGTGSSALFIKVSSLSLLHSFSTIFHFY